MPCMNGKRLEDQLRKLLWDIKAVYDIAPGAAFEKALISAEVLFQENDLRTQRRIGREIAFGNREGENTIRAAEGVKVATCSNFRSNEVFLKYIDIKPVPDTSK